MLLNLYSGGYPAKGAEEKRIRHYLPNGKIVFATRREMAPILERMFPQEEIEEIATKPKIVEVRVKTKRADAVAIQADFPKSMPKIPEPHQRMVRNIQVKPSLDAYAEGIRLRKQRKDEDEWLIVTLH